jgi:phage terminase Nu1 subunit (DNA packaging protein)
MIPLLTREELARLLNVSTRTVDRWRAMGLDLGEVRAHPQALPRFDPEKVQQAISSRGFPKARKRPGTESRFQKTASRQKELADCGSSQSPEITVG